VREGKRPQRDCRTAFLLAFLAQDASPIGTPSLAGDKMTDPQLLQSAFREHRQGNHKKARGLYLRALKRFPRWAEAHHLYGMLLQELGDHRAALKHLREAVRLAPDKVNFHFNHGVVAAAGGLPAEAVAAYDHVLALAPEDADALSNKGLALLALEEFEAGEEAFRKALALRPAHVQALVNLGKALLDRNRFEETEGIFRKAVALVPDLAESHFGFGRTLEEKQDWKGAEESYRKALTLRPDFFEARNNLGTVLAGQGRYKEAQDVFRQTCLSRHGPLLEGPPEREARPGLLVNRFQLHDRMERLLHLLDEGLIDPAFASAAQAYQRLLEDLGPGGTELVSLTAAQSRSFGALHDRLIFWRDALRQPEGAVNRDQDFATIEDAFLEDKLAGVIIDNLLKPEALAALNRFCTENTIYFGRDAGNFVAARLATGFNCSLMYQIAEELKAALPRVIGPRFLSNMWVYRHGAEGRGVDLHSDQAAVTFNFYIGPDEGNLDPDHGGLLLYDREQPLDWDWYTTNLKKLDPGVQARMQEHLSGAEARSLPYRCNRAVLFRSNLFHKSDSYCFRDDFHLRRMNVTLLFGSHCAIAET
jgi:tetratricopeptide (TPR) repeat protein